MQGPLGAGRVLGRRQGAAGGHGAEGAEGEDGGVVGVAGRSWTAASQVLRGDRGEQVQTDTPGSGMVFFSPEQEKESVFHTFHSYI